MSHVTATPGETCYIGTFRGAPMKIAHEPWGNLNTKSCARCGRKLAVPADD